ncbi:MAG: hypothetical protein EOP06_32090, partial [Proteobacteria bacterium]
MKHLFFLTFLMSLSVSGQAQEVAIDTNYYTPPPMVRERVLTEDPENNPRFQSGGSRRANRRQELLDKLDEVQTWYVGAETGIRS